MVPCCALPLPVPLVGKSPSVLIHYFSSHPAAFGFQASSPPDNITLKPTNKKTNQNLSDFQAGIDSAAHATLDTKQLVSCRRTVPVGNIASLQCYD